MNRSPGPEGLSTCPGRGVMLDTGHFLALVPLPQGMSVSHMISVLCVYILLSAPCCQFVGGMLFSVKVTTPACDAPLTVPDVDAQRRWRLIQSLVLGTVWGPWPGSILCDVTFEITSLGLRVPDPHLPCVQGLLSRGISGLWASHLFRTL